MSVRTIPDSRLHPTPKTTIDAIMYCVRERGFDALQEPANIERLSRCDDAAIDEINTRIKKRDVGHHHGD
jgi:hypothetical protein